MPTKQEFLQEALKSAVKGTAVPALLLLKVIKHYHDAIGAHKRDMTVNQAILRTQKKERETHSNQLFSYDREIRRLSTLPHIKGEKGDEGRAGRDGMDADEEQIARSVLARIPKPADGRHGIDGQNGSDGKDAVFDEKAFMNKLLGRIKNEQLLDLTHVKGAQGFIKDGIKYRFEELMHGGGSKGSSGTQVYNEIVSGSGTTFTLTNTPTVGTVVIYGNGQRLTPGAGNDYTISGATITTINSFPAGAILADYQH